MITVDAMGDACPIPVIKTKKALAELNGSGELEVFVDNEIAVQNVSKMAANAGGDVASEQISEGKYRVAIRLAGDGTTGERDTEEKAEKNRQRRLPEKRRNIRSSLCLPTGWEAEMMNWEKC